MIIYKAENIINNKVYIGKTIQLLTIRKQSHKYDANRGSSFYFHRAIRKYGMKSFEWSILCETDSKLKLNVLEKFYIACYKKMTTLYNMTDGGENPPIPTKETRRKQGNTLRGRKHSEETKQKLSQANRGQKRSEEFKRKLSERMTGFKHSEETKKLIGEKGKGRHHTEEARKKISEGHKGISTWNKGIPTSEETKIKLSLALKGRKGKPLSEETKRKISKAHKGRTAWNKGLTKEIDKRIMKYSNTKMGHSVSLKTRKKISDSLKKRTA